MKPTTVLEVVATLLIGAGVAWRYDLALALIVIGALLLVGANLRGVADDAAPGREEGWRRR